ncbi:MAG: molybdopterin synthase catalytic subunit MoaE [Halomonadaceae bacterium]|nr:MAG: molybdopterin synthase catalytic subunit MoaE [Halomonadaceae bacterium]
MIHIQQEDFDSGAELQALEASGPATGAVCSFTGLARDYGDKEGVSALFLEHYPGMTEAAIENILRDAHERWPLQGVRVIHRVGTLQPGERIVFVGVASSHRKEAFAACEFIMDYLKTGAPFWKKEITAQGEHWVEQKASDQSASQRWQKTP